MDDFYLRKFPQSPNVTWLAIAALRFRRKFFSEVFYEVSCQLRSISDSGNSAMAALRFRRSMLILIHQTLSVALRCRVHRRISSCRSDLRCDLPNSDRCRPFSWTCPMYYVLRLEPPSIHFDGWSSRPRCERLQRSSHH